MSDLTDIISGVTEAITAAGKPLVIRRFTLVSDPTKPTQPPVSTPVDIACFGYIAVERGWDNANRVVISSTNAYIDPLSITGNTVELLTVVTGQGDVLIDGEREYVLSRTTHPEFQGRVVLFQHVGIS